MSINHIEQLVTPVVPRTVDKQQLYVYMPLAGYKTAGVAKYNPRDFIFTENGVTLRSDVSKVIIDFDIDAERNIISVTYSDKTVVNMPLTMSSATVFESKLSTVIEFVDDSFIQLSDDTYVLYINKSQHSQDNSDYIVQVEEYSDNGYSNIAVDILKHSDGNLLLSSVRPFVGRVIILGDIYKLSLDKYDKVEGIDIVNDYGDNHISLYNSGHSTNIRPGNINLIDDSNNMLSIRPTGVSFSNIDGDYVALSFHSSGTIATEEHVEDNFYKKDDYINIGVDYNDEPSLVVTAPDANSETNYTNNGMQIFDYGGGGYSEYCQDHIQFSNGDDINSELTFPDESGTIATREWVNKQGFGSSLDIQIDGTSIVENGVANIPIASTNKLGVINTVDIEKNKTDIKILYAGLKQKNIIIPATLDNTVESRQTANGLTVVDGSTATVNKIVGNTVKSRNICLPISARSVQDFGALENTTIRQISENAIYLGVSGGNYYRGSKSVKDLLITSEKITATLLAEFYGIGIPVRVASGVDIVITAKTTTTDGYRLSYMFFDESGNYIKGTATDGKLHTPENAYWLIAVFENGGKANSTITVEDIMVEYGTTATEYQPYFAGFKHAKFKGIKSTGRNLFVSPHLRTPKTYDPTNISENDVYYGLTYTGSQYTAAITDITTTEGSITFKQNMAQSVAVGFPIKVEGLTSVYLRVKASFSTKLYYGFIFLNANGEVLRNSASYNSVHDGIAYVSIPTVPEGAVWWIPILGEVYDTLTNIPITLSDIMASTVDIPYEPYFAPSVMPLPETVELGKWDYIENGQVVRQTIIENFDSAKYDETAGTYNGTTDFILTEDRTKVAYKRTATSTELSFDNTYLVWDKGTEQMQLENSESVPTVTAEYLILGGAE